MEIAHVVRARLAFRIYLVGLAQMAVVAAGFFALLHANRPQGEGPREELGRFVAGSIERDLRDRGALDRELARARDALHATVIVTDPDGAVLATSEPPSPAAEDRPGRDATRGMRFATALRFPDGRSGRVEVWPLGPPPAPPSFGTRVVPLVLIVVGVSSLLLARSLTRPLRKLSSAARAFGGGDLTARAALREGDELGDVSRAFDEMAERVTSLLRSEKELLANVSHELRTPLARIRVALDIAAEGDIDVARESLADIAGDLDELERLISDVLTAARLDLGDGSLPTGIPPLRRERVDLRALLEHAASRFRAAHPARALAIDMADALPAVDGDPAQPATAAVGMVAVDSTPQGAQIQVDGRFDSSWVTPFTVSQLPPGQHSIVVSKAGYAAETRAINVASGSKNSLAVHLNPLTAMVSVSSNPSGASILIDGRDTGKATPAQITLEKGSHNVLVRKAGYLDETMTAEGQPGQTIGFAPNLRPLGSTDEIKSVGKFKKMFGGKDATAGMGSVSIRTTPKGAQISVNQRILDHPSPAEFLLNPGNYVVDITAPGCKPLRRVITVEKNGKVAIDETLEKE